MAQKQVATERRAEIIKTTISVLAFEGYASVTMRSIADRIGIHLSTLQYYFPTKRDLLREAIDKCIEPDFLRQQQLAHDSGADPRSQLSQVVGVHLHACTDPLISKVFSTLWGMAAHDHDVEELLNDFYEQQVQTYAELLNGLNPGWSRKKCVNRAVLLVAQLEGLVLFVSPGKSKSGLADMKVLRTELLHLIAPGGGPA